MNALPGDKALASPSKRFSTMPKAASIYADFFSPTLVESARVGSSPNKASVADFLSQNNHAGIVISIIGGLVIDQCPRNMAINLIARNKTIS